MAISNYIKQEYNKEKRLGKSHNIKDNNFTMSELYYINTLLFSMVVNNTKLNKKAWKSHYKEDDNSFIVGIKLSNKNYCFLFDLKYWKYFKCKEVDEQDEEEFNNFQDLGKLIEELK